MIKITTTKEKFLAIINITTQIITHFNTEILIMKRNSEYARTRADIFIITELNRKMRSKFITIEHKPNNYKFSFSFNEIQAYCIIQYYNSVKLDPYSMATMQEISNPIYRHLLS